MKGMKPLDYTQSRGFMPFMAVQTPQYKDEAALLRELGATVESEAGQGFKGQAAVGFGEAVNEWFDVAITLGPILEGYSQSLMYVAQEHATNDAEQAQRAGQLADRLGGGPR